MLENQLFNPFEPEASAAVQNARRPSANSLGPTSKPDIQRCGGVYYRLPVTVVLAFREDLALTAMVTEKLSAAVTARIEGLGGQGLACTVTASHVLVKLLLPPVLSVERLVVWLHRELAAAWAILTGDLLPVAGGYLADACDPESSEIQGFLDTVRPRPSLF